MDSCDSALRHITPAQLPASHCLLNSKQKVGKTENPDLLGRMGFAPRRGAGGGRKPPIQFTSEELKQSSQKDVVEKAEGSVAMGDDLCAWRGAGERDVGAAVDSLKIRLEPSLSCGSHIWLKFSHRHCTRSPRWTCRVLRQYLCESSEAAEPLLWWFSFKKKKK